MEEKRMTKQDAIYHDLKNKILSGYYQPWGTMDNESVLCKRYDVSRTTLQKAIQHLKQDGLVHSRQGAGTFVNPPEFFNLYSLRSLSERNAARGRTVESKVLFYEEVPCGNLSDIFHLGSDEPLVHYSRQRFLDGKPRLVDNAYMPRYLFRNLNEETLHGSMLSYMETCGYTVSHDLQTIRPIVADDHIANLLCIQIGTPIFQTDHVIYSTRNVVLQFVSEISNEQEIKTQSVR